ncbi:MAG: hypothetical protein IJ158_01700 [Treponema sp.]|nr:hypothetical protein [Treponema sp.]
MKTLKKHFVIIASISLLLLAGCSDGSSSGSGEGKGSGGNTVTDIKQSNKVLSFAKLTDAKALAGVSSESGATKNIAARAATGEDSAIVKILEDGNISSLLSFPSEISVPPQISDMIKSETPNGTFLYIIFDDYKTRYNYTAADGTKLKGYIGQILCVHEDGAFHDILGTEGDSVPDSLLTSWSKIHNSLQFDTTGNMYYMIYNKSSNASVLYRYSPFTGTKTALTAAISGVSVNTFQISKDGKWMFTNGNSGNNNFLRATPISDTENPQDILYGNDKYVNSDAWVYDDATDSVYVASDSNLYKYIKDAATGKFSTDSYETLVGSSESWKEIEKKQNEFWEKKSAFFNVLYGGGDSPLFDNHSEYTYTADWTGYIEYWDSIAGSTNITILNDDGSLNAENLLAGLLIKAWDSLSESKRKWVTDDEGRSKQVYLTTDDVDLRFDLFADIEGFESLAEATNGKKNADALAALDTKEKRGLLYRLLNGYDNQSRYSYDSTWKCYAHNFFADVLYVKDTDNLLVDADDSAFSKSTVKTDKFTSNGLNYNDILTNAQQTNWTTVYTLGTAYQKEDGTADTQKILELFFSYCNEEGDKEFRLDVFKGDENYGDLYAEGLTDNDAIAYVTETKERLQLLRGYIANEKPSASTKDYNYYHYLKILHETCFLKETGTSACTLSEYSGSSNSFSISSFVLDGEILWGTGINWDSEKQKYILQFMKILDSNHEFSGDIIGLDISDDFSKGNFDSNSQQIADGYVYYRNNISGSSYDIRRIPLEEAGVEENLFTNVSGNWEVLSFTVGGDYLYYSSYRGTAINNGRITITTKENTPLDSTFKLTSLTAY